MKRLIIMIILSAFVGCASVAPVLTPAGLTDTVSELKGISGDKNLTDVQRVIIRHAIGDLRDAGSVVKKVDSLQDQVVKESHDAGAGRLVYWLIGLAIAGVGLYLSKKIFKW